VEKPEQEDLSALLAHLDLVAPQDLVVKREKLAVMDQEALEDPVDQLVLVVRQVKQEREDP